MIRAEAETCFLQMMNKTFSKTLPMLLLSLMIVNISVHTKAKTTQSTMLNGNRKMRNGIRKIYVGIVDYPTRVLVPSKTGVVIKGSFLTHLLPSERFATESVRCLA